MATEIERRFIVDPFALAFGIPSLKDLNMRRIVQGYFASTNAHSGVVRVRVDEMAGTGYITAKFKHLADSFNDEFEYEIPYADAAHMIRRLGIKVSKDRYALPVDGSDLVWEIDVFTGLDAPHIIAEIEIPSVDTQIVIPDWCVVEITDVGGVSNFDLARDRAAAHSRLWDHYHGRNYD